MNHNPDTLTNLADQLAEQLQKLEQLGAHEGPIKAGFAIVGMLYHAARHPEAASAPIPRMIADSDRTLAMARHAVSRLEGNAR